MRDHSDGYDLIIIDPPGYKPEPLGTFDLTPYRTSEISGHGKDLATKLAYAHHRDHLEELINAHRKVAMVRNTVRRAPMRYEGWLRDERPFAFISGNGHTALVIGKRNAAYAIHAPAVVDTIAVDLDTLRVEPGAAAAWFSRLLSTLDTQ